MNSYVNVSRYEDDIVVSFYIEYDEVMAVAAKMEEINENAYMNGYNWEAFLNFYLENNEPELLEDMDTDSEAGMYSASYSYSEENENKANRLAEIISELIESPEKIYEVLEENGDDIEWD